MKLPDFEYLAPSTPAEVVALLAAHRGEAKVIAGGQSLLPTMAFRLARPSLLIDLRNVEGLDSITIDDSGVSLGARARWCDIENDERLRAAHPLLVAAVRHIAHYQIRNRGTVGGSLAHADPAAELPCIAATCEAEIRILSPGEERCVKAAEFFCGPLTTVLAEDEIILEMRLPAWPAGRRWAFREFSMRPGDFALAAIALFYDSDAQGAARNVHIGACGACDYPRRLIGAEQALNGHALDSNTASQVVRIAAGEVDSIQDIHAGAEYRRALVATLVERALLAAAARDA